MNFKVLEDVSSRRTAHAAQRQRWLRLAPLMLACVVLAACESEGGRVRPPSTNVSVIHVAGSFGNLEFRRVERLEGTLSYRSSQAFSWDSGPYTFNIDATIPGLNTPIRLYTFTADLTAGNDHSIVLTEANGWLHELILEAPQVELSETDAEIIIVNTAAGLETAVDVYIEPPGTVLAAATPRGSVDFLESLPAAAIAPGEYELSLTQAGNPTSVVMVSDPFEIAGSARTTLSVIDGLTSASPAAALVSSAGTDTPLSDRELRAGIRVLNAMTSRDPIDITVNSNFSPPLIPNALFAEPTDYALVVPGEHTLQVTPAGNPGAIEVETTFRAFPGQRGTWFVRGDPGALAAVYSPDSQRLIRDIAEVTVYYGGTTVNSVDVFIVPPDTDPNTVLPTATLTENTPLSFVYLGLGGYTVTVRESGTQNVLAGPIAAGIGFEGSYGVLITNGESGAGMDVTLIDRFTL